MRGTQFGVLLAHRPLLQALEALRKLRTEKSQEVKELKLKLEHTKTLKDQASVRCVACRRVFLDVNQPITGLAVPCSSQQPPIGITHVYDTSQNRVAVLLPQKLRSEEKQGRARLRELQEHIGRLDQESQVRYIQKVVSCLRYLAFEPEQTGPGALGKHRAAQHAWRGTVCHATARLAPVHVHAWACRFMIVKMLAWAAPMPRRRRAPGCGSLPRSSTRLPTLARCEVAELGGKAWRLLLPPHRCCCRRTAAAAVAIAGRRAMPLHTGVEQAVNCSVACYHGPIVSILF